MLIFKKIFDFSFSLFLLLLLLPLLILVSILIKLDSKGPILFVQKRIGKNEKYFDIYKFRTMVHRNPDSIDQLNEKVLLNNTDVRITRVGRLLRITSVDELPQLVNIILGDMSFIGPRPILFEQSKYIPPKYKLRFSVLPGLTGLAQVRGRRSLGWRQQLGFDYQYVCNLSLLEDLNIFFNTIKIVICGSGIYGDDVENWRSYKDFLNGEAPKDIDVELAMNKLELQNNRK